jgi:hypothetical protein
MSAKAKGIVLLVIGIFDWFTRETLKTVFFERVVHTMSPNANALIEYGPPLAFAGFGLYFLWQSAVPKRQRTRLYMFSVLVMVVGGVAFATGAFMFRAETGHFPLLGGEAESKPPEPSNKEHSSTPTQSLTPAFRYVWEALTPQQMSRVRSDLRLIQHPADRPLFIGCSNDNCRDFAESFASVFNDLNWPNVTIEERSAPEFKGVTVEYFMKEQNPTIGYTSTDPKIAVAIADAIERATQGRVKTRVRPAGLIPTRIIIGPKP